MKVLKHASKYSLRLVKESEAVYQAGRTINSPAEFAEYLRGAFRIEELPEEILGIVCLNMKNNIIAIMEVSHGTLSGAITHPREIFKRAICANAAHIILFHNHPSGDTTPSNEDRDMTSRIIKAGEIIGIKVLDHLIITEDSYGSMKEQFDCIFN